MTERRFYTWASLLPFILPAVAVPVAWPAMRAHVVAENGIARLAAFISFTSVFSTVPYAIALAVILWRYRNSSPRDFRSVVWTLPIWIALPFALAFAIPWGRGGGGASRFGVGMLAGAAAALLIGYCYAALIEFLHLVAKASGWIRDPAPPAAASAPQPGALRGTANS